MHKIAFTVTQNGIPLDEAKYNFDENTKTFSTNESNLVLDFGKIDSYTFDTGSSCTFKTGSNCTFNTEYSCTFKTGSSCTFNTGSNCTFNTWHNCAFKTESGCTFKTGSSCTFKTGSNCTFNTEYSCAFNTWHNCTFNTGSDCTFKTGFGCTFKTGYGCTFNTGSDCTFNTGSDCIFDTGYGCVIIRRDFFQVIQPLEGERIQVCPQDIGGFLANGYLNRDISLGEHIVADGILSRILSKKGNLFKVLIHGTDAPSFLIEQNGIFSHGVTLKKARESLVYKNSNRDTSAYTSLTIESEVSYETSIQMYMAITGACELGTKLFVEKQVIKPSYTIQELITITEGQYNCGIFKEFFMKDKN